MLYFCFCSESKVSRINMNHTRIITQNSIRYLIPIEKIEWTRKSSVVSVEQTWKIVNLKS